MGAVTISNVPEGVVSFHRREADAKAASLEQHLRSRLVADARKAHDAIFTVVSQFHSAMDARYGVTGSIAAVLADLRAVRGRACTATRARSRA
jgi:hypothetical protein